MKKLLIFFYFVFGLALYAYPGSINECKTDIYYGNGVWNEYEHADDSRDKLQKRIIDLEIINNNSTLQAKYGTVKLQYNYSYGKMLDVLETYYQLKEAGQVNDLEFFAVMMILTQGNMVLSAEATLALRSQMPFVEQTEETDVNAMIQKYYFESFRYSHRVLLVSHSQGNLFANRVYDKIHPSGYQDYFANVQVASPASSVHAKNGMYVTGLVDPVINPIPGSMEYNGVLMLPGGHRFVEAYLDSSDTYDRIVKGIKAQLENLDNAPSQFEITEHAGCLCYDKYVKVEHRFDYGLTKNIQKHRIKNFAGDGAGKIYPVDGKYVRAACGGVKIEEVDEGDVCLA